MSIITITNGIYSNAEEIVTRVAEKCDSRIVSDNEIIDYTHKKFNIKPTTLEKVIEDKPLAFNDFTHEKEKCLAHMKKAISELAASGNVIFHGILGHLIPEQTTHALRVLIITDKKNRMKRGMEIIGLSEHEAVDKIDAADKRATVWTNSIRGKKAWDPALYDMVIPTDKMSAPKAFELITQSLDKLLFTEEDLVKKELEDLDLLARIEITLASLGKGLLATARNGNVLVTIDRKVMMLGAFQQKIIQAIEKIDGVKSVTTKIGKNYYKDTIVRNYEFETPLRLLLVDDEKEFVHTLSERLKMRQFTSEVVYNGKQALDFTDEVDTQVMVLDLKMPGIDGFEVLKQIKETKPEIEVIILTGHGSREDEKKCLEMGAFAYLQKPADIDLLTETIKKAHAKVTAP